MEQRSTSRHHTRQQTIDVTAEIQKLREAIENRIVHTPFLNKPLSKEAIKDLKEKREKKNLSWSKYKRGLLLDWREAVQKITVHVAKEADATAIASWAINQDEVAYVGEEGTKLQERRVRQWINASLGAFILAYPQEKHRSISIAFANISLLENHKRNFEVGRLLVEPEWRRMGLGSSLLQHLCSTLSEICKDLNSGSSSRRSILARVVVQNTIGVRLVEGLPFKEETKVANLPDNTRYKWYRYITGSETSRFGNELKMLREEVEISQEYLAFQVSLRRTTINMIEAGRRFPSFESLPKICTVLGRKGQDQRIRLLLAAIGEEREKHTYPPIAEEHDTSQCDLWVITDKLAELEPELQSLLSNSISALESSFDRYYFLPFGAWDRQGKTLLEKFRAANINKNNLSQHFRFYETDDEALCVLRIAIENPKTLGRIKVTIGGEGYTRVPLDAEQSYRLRDFIKSKVDKLEANQKIKGYHSCFP